MAGVRTDDMMPARIHRGLLGRALLLIAALAGPAMAAPREPPIAAAEQRFADWLDAGYATASLRAGPMTRLDGLDLAAWERARDRATRRLADALARVPADDRGVEDARALARMRQVLAEARPAPAASNPDETAASCEGAADPELGRAALSAALYACFEHFGNHVRFEERTISRTTALELFQEIDDGTRRQALFDALRPLWAHIHAEGRRPSPYQRLIRLAAAEAAAQGASPIDRAAHTVGETPAQVEAQLVAVLEAWRAANPGPMMEPWDYWFDMTSGVRPLNDLIPPQRIPVLCQDYYRDLGVDLAALGVIEDLEVRPGKAPLAYTDYVRIGRRTPDGWRPALVRVSANVEQGGLFVLNEIVHEDGHAVHMMAVRTRPAFYDLGDDLFLEAFADVTSWSVAEPVWQRRYLGRSIDAPVALRALFANVVLDVAWGLFEQRMLRDPQAEPNRVWTDITARYLRIRPHPELAWWALRVQLVDVPGYMINYGLGAMVTADLRDRLRAAIGPFDAGNPRWFSYASDHLLRYGAAIDTPELLGRFLGRPVSISPLLAQIERVGREAH